MCVYRYTQMLYTHTYLHRFSKIKRSIKWSIKCIIFQHVFSQLAFFPFNIEYILANFKRQNICLNLFLCVCLCSNMSDFFVTPWTSPLGSSVNGSLQARIPEWVAILSPGDFPDQSQDMEAALNIDVVRIYNGILHSHKRAKQCHVQQHGWTQRLSYYVK